MISGTDRQVESQKKIIINYNPFHVGLKKLLNFGLQTTEL